MRIVIWEGKSWPAELLLFNNEFGPGVGPMPTFRWIFTLGVGMSISGKTSDDGLPPAKNGEIAIERAVERLYRQHLQDRAARPVQPDGSRSWWWTLTVRPKVIISRGDDLVGRIALTKPDDGLGSATEFYFGDAHAKIGGVEFFNWRNRLGRSFFDPKSGGPMIDNLAVIRTFDHNGRHLRDFVDDVFCDDPPNPYFSHYPSGLGDAESVPVYHQHKSGESPPRPEIRPHIRAASLLHERLRAPRQPTLSSALSTLQPDQYRLVSMPASRSVIIEGGPGTGKSIIASHRAGYLISDDPTHESDFKDCLLVVGPTSGYTDYVGEVIYELTGNSPRVGVCSLTQVEQVRLESDAPFSVPKPIVRSLPEVLDKAWIRLTAKHGAPDTAEQLYKYVRENGSIARRLTQELYWLNFLRKLPPYEQAKSRADSGWLLTAIEQRFPDDKAPPRIGHIIVDEAQDVTPTQWGKLRKLNEGNTWTILGDMNQRRTDHTFKNWSDVSKAIGLPSDTEPVKLTTGYRSTQPILELAHRLLGPGGTSPLALKPDGPKPDIVRAPLRLATTVSQQVGKLVGKYPGGRVAVISAMPGPILTEVNESHPNSDVTVLTSFEARGLEFDAVIVAEPTDFPRNDRRRNGPLYTALTRANKELVIVHTKGIPPDLEQKQPVTVTPRTRVSAAVTASPEDPGKNKKPKSRRPRKRRARRSRQTPPPADAS